MERNPRPLIAVGVGAVAAVAAAVLAFQFVRPAGPAAAEARAAAAKAEAAPALWLITDADSRVWLFGTIHIMPPGLRWSSTSFEYAFAEADVLWMEIDDPEGGDDLGWLVERYGTDDTTRLSSRLAAPEKVQLAAAAAEIGLTVDEIDRAKPWFAAMGLQVAQVTRAGYDRSAGVERVLKRRAVRADLPVRGLETTEQQIRLLAGLSDAAQMDYLRQTLADQDEGTIRLDRIAGAWSVGDVETLEGEINADIRRTDAELYRTVFTGRNLRWARQIDDILDGSGDVFIAVGAGHLVGPDSVQVQLAKRGIKVERVR